jgi:hypothetical protein
MDEANSTDTPHDFKMSKKVKKKNMKKGICTICQKILKFSGICST